MGCRGKQAESESRGFRRAAETCTPAACAPRRAMIHHRDTETQSETASGETAKASAPILGFPGLRFISPLCTSVPLWFSFMSEFSDLLRKSWGAHAARVLNPAARRIHFQLTLYSLQAQSLNGVSREASRV